MKALIIGGNGFIGTNLADELMSRGHQVAIFDRYPSRYRQPDPRINYIFADFANHGEVAAALRGIDCVYHLAYTTLPHTSNEDPSFDVRSNVIDSLQLFQSCLDNSVSKVVFISSGGTVYGTPRSSPIPEEHPTEPICSYGITKLTIEKYLALFHHLHKLDYVVVRLANPYGILQNPHAKQGVIAVYLGNITSGKPLSIWGDGSVTRDYIYITDAARALALAGEYNAKSNEPRIFNIGSGSGASIKEIVETIKATVSMPVKVEYHEARPEDVPVNVLDISRANRLLQWQPEVSLTEGISRTWQWLQGLTATNISIG